MAKKQPLYFRTIADASETYYKECKAAQDKELAVAKAIHARLGNGFTETELAEYLLCGPHQRFFRMTNNQDKRDDAIAALVDAKLWDRTYRDFEDLHDAVVREIGSCKGVGLSIRTSP